MVSALAGGIRPLAGACCCWPEPLEFVYEKL